VLIREEAQIKARGKFGGIPLKIRVYGNAIFEISAINVAR
jgi:hypothetical protein